MATSGSFRTSSYTLDGTTIGLEFAWSRKSYSVADNATTINWTLTGYGNKSSAYSFNSGNFTVVVNGVTVYSDSTRRYVGNGTLVASGTATISHNTDGTKSFSASAQAGIYYVAVNCSGSGSWTLDSIPRQANIASAPAFNDEENPTITYTNAAGNSVASLDACISLTGSKDDIPYRAISKTGTSYTFELTDEERDTLRNACTGANSRTVIFYVRTVIAGVTYYSTLSRTLSIVNANPVINSADAEDTNETAFAVTGDNQTMIRGFNDIYASMAATALKGATIKSYKIKNGNTTIEQASGNFVDAESSVFVFSVTDSRGNTAEQSIELALIEYIKLTCDLNSEAPDAEGNLSFDITGNCFAGSFGDIENEVQVSFRYKENGGEYTGWTEIETRLGMDNRYSARVELSGLNYQSSYTFQAYAYDLLDEVTTGEETRTTIPIFDWSKNDFNFNVDTKFQKDILVKDEEGNEYSLLEIVGGLNSKISHVGMIIFSTTLDTMEKVIVVYGGTKWEQIKGRFLLGVGEPEDNTNTYYGTDLTYNGTSKFNESVGTLGGTSRHALSINEMPAHEGHLLGNNTTSGGNSTYTLTTDNAVVFRNRGWNVYAGNELYPAGYTRGSTQAHNNMPPYLAVYIWLRTG